MKITICGKGGCGKSTVTSLLAKEFARMGKTVLVVDSDESNFGLHRQLGVELPRDFTEYFGGKDKAFKKMMAGEILDTVKKAAYLNKIGSPDEVGQAAAFLASPAASFINGATLMVDGGSCEGNLH